MKSKQLYVAILIGLFALIMVFACSDQPPEQSQSVISDPIQLPTENYSQEQSSDLQVTDDLPDNYESAFELVFPTAAIQPVSAWRAPPYPVPWALRPEDHFYFSRPIPSGAKNWPNSQFRYGSTYFGEETTHTGIDLGAARDTDVIAAGPGEVVWVGYGLYRGIEDPTDPYGLSIAIRHDFGHQEQQLFTVYAHLASAEVWRGQRVEMNEKIGTVGDSGHATGAHLHFEVRLGENRFFSTRNPELWMVPSEGSGVLGGQILSTRGLLLEEQLVQIRNMDTGQKWEAWTYAFGTVHPDEVYGENIAIGDLPSGAYEIRIDFAGKSHLKYLYLYPGQTNMVYFKGRQGFQPDPLTAEYNYSEPPY